MKFFKKYSSTIFISLNHADILNLTGIENIIRQTLIKMKLLCWACYPEKMITERDACTPVFVAALFTIAGTQKQPGYPLTDEWIKKL